MAELARRLAAFLLLPLQAAAATVIIGTSGVAFTGANPTIQAGDTIQWNGLSPGHNVAQTNSLSPMAYNGGFYSGAISAVSSFSHQFNSPGTYYYFCEQHAGANMNGTITVVTPTPSPTACLTPTHSDTPNPSFSPSDTPTLSPTPTPSPALTATPSATVTPTPASLAQSFAGVQDLRLLASPIRGTLRLWAKLQGAADGAELRVFSAAGTLLLARDLGPQGPGDARWAVPLPGLAAQPLWIQLRVRQDGRWRGGPTLRSFLLP